MAYELAPLPYDYAALEPFIDAETMKLHHDKHHQAYVNNVNAALANHPDAGRQVRRRPDPRSGPGSRGDPRRGPQQRRRPLQPHRLLEPDGPGGLRRHRRRAHRPHRRADFQADFGDFEAFKKTFNETTAKQFGSGWGWLVFAAGKLKVITTANQDSPLTQGLYPILGNDVWEHAYYLKYQNRRPDYLAAWWNVVNWARSQQALRRRQRVKGSRNSF